MSIKKIGETALYYDPAPSPKEEKVERCPLCKMEMFVNKEGKLQCPNLVYHEMNPETKKLFKKYHWFGQVRAHVKSSVSLKGKPLDTPIVKCEKCGGDLNLDFLIDNEGIALAKLLLDMEERGKLYEKWNELEQKMERMDLYNFQLEKEKLLNQFYKQEQAGVSLSHLAEINARCDHCSVPIGKLEILLEMTVPPADFKAYGWEDLYRLTTGIPKEVKAKVAFELGYKSFDALRKWAENPALSELESLVKEFREKFAKLDVSDALIYDFTKQLDGLMTDVPKEMTRRKRILIEKVQDIAKMDAAGK